MIRYYIPINKIAVQVPKDYFLEFQNITYKATHLTEFEGVSDLVFKDNPNCFVVKSTTDIYGRFSTYEEADGFYEKITKDLNERYSHLVY